METEAGSEARKPGRTHVRSETENAMGDRKTKDSLKRLQLRGRFSLSTKTGVNEMNETRLKAATLVWKGIPQDILELASDCPSCGKRPRWVHRNGSNLQWRLDCCDTNEYGNHHGTGNEIDAIIEWNATAADAAEAESEAAYCERWAVTLEDMGDNAAAARWRDLAKEERRLAA